MASGEAKTVSRRLNLCIVSLKRAGRAVKRVPALFLPCIFRSFARRAVFYPGHARDVAGKNVSVFVVRKKPNNERSWRCDVCVLCTQLVRRMKFCVSSSDISVHLAGPRAYEEQMEPADGMRQAETPVPLVLHSAATYATSSRVGSASLGTGSCFDGVCCKTNNTNLPRSLQGFRGCYEVYGLTMTATTIDEDPPHTELPPSPCLARFCEQFRAEVGKDLRT